MTLKFLSNVVTAGLIFAAASSVAEEGTGQVAPRFGAAAMTARMPGPGMMGGYAQCRGAMPIMGMMTMMGPTLYNQHAEGCLTFMKTELKITQAQTPQWNAFVEAVRSNVATMTEMYESMMLLDDPSTTLSERLVLEEKTMTSHLASLKRIEHSLDTLYNVLSEDQKRTAMRLPLVQWVFQRTK